ncbi:hypothetical protein AEM42_14940 [Betaproteobacteria bacterium UKL13-2]|nr:hypothetical protein AEM42_14940 [Betaproteobacteria bacterium UKL13-2]HCG54092.1 hypothetical protein [Betaproteobacteria bacterium]
MLIHGAFNVPNRRQKLAHIDKKQPAILLARITVLHLFFETQCWSLNQNSIQHIGCGFST